MACRAIQYSDEMYCAKCNLRWDINDPEPPDCPVLKLESEKEKQRQVAHGIQN